MFPGQTTRLLPLHLALSDPRRSIPILWTSGDATLNRIGGINWRTHEFFVGSPAELTEPFLGIRHKGHISDYEYLVEIDSILLRGGKYAKEVIINVTYNANHLLAGWAGNACSLARRVACNPPPP